MIQLWRWGNSFLPLGAISALPAVGIRLLDIGEHAYGGLDFEMLHSGHRVRPALYLGHVPDRSGYKTGRLFQPWACSCC